MSRLLLFPILLLLSLSSAATPIDNSYQSDFNSAYKDHPNIPRGILEAVSYTNTRFTHLTENEASSCTGMPQALTVMGLMRDGQGWFRNNLELISNLSGVDQQEILSDPATCISAYADAFDKVYSGNSSFRVGGTNTVGKISFTLKLLSELPINENQGNQFAMKSFLYAVLTFMNDESMAAQYGFMQYNFNLRNYFGDENFNVLSAPSVRISGNHINDNRGNEFRAGSDEFNVQSPDYGPALWNQAASCNYSSRNGVLISAVTIHTVQGTYAGCISWFQNCAASVSAHYVLRSSDGQVTQMVYESQKAWHVGSENPYTIGLEHEGYVTNASWYTTAMYTSSAALVANICADNNIDPLRTGWWPWLPTTYYNQSSIPGACTKVKGHQHYPNQTHNDPGVNWNWNYYYQLINATPGATVYTTASGTFYDSGGSAANYSDDERLVWTIAPVNATSVTVNFSSFSAENTWDYLYIYDGNSISSPLIGYYTGTNNPGTITSSGGSLTFEWRSDCATAAAGWNATWTSTINNTQADVTAPTTQVNINGIWQTQNFVANFSDSDNVGGSGLEKSYYQVIDYDGADWRANNTRGFFSDNFDLPVIHSDWTTATGTWNINNTVLEQSDENLTNTNIYAPLTQNLSNRYLYHWAGKIDGTGNNRRAGFHFFCDNPSQTNRGNSYFVWFRVDQSVCEFYEVINDTFYLRNSAAMTVNANQWYDYKVIYDRVTGKMSVYQDNVFIGSWTDSTPLATGTHVSFRSGNSNWQVNNFKVYRSRFSNQATAVTVGNCSGCDIRYQNINPATPAGRVKSIVADTAGNLSAISYQDINVDWTAPTAILTVDDSLGSDIDLLTVNTDLWGDWTPSSDTNSGLARYWFAIGTTPCDSNVITWTNNWGYDTAHVTNMTLFTGQMYYFSVRAENGAGLVTPCYSSDGVLVDLTTGVFNSESGSITAGTYPVPASEFTILNYNLATNTDVIIELYSSNGQKAELYNGMQLSGTHQLQLNKDDLSLSAGYYFIVVSTENDRLVVPVLFNN
jgi:N-acetyl-anhydromuramyl-L-alanine amidase AmpD